jgi:hypothetical protein
MIRKNEADRNVVNSLFVLPHELKRWIEEKARQDERSQSATVVRILRARMIAEQSEKAAG